MLHGSQVRCQAVEPWFQPQAITAGGEPTFRGTIGFGLSLTQARRVDQLGFWDELADGLLSAHAVSLFDASGSLLASSVVPQGTAALLVDGFRWVSIPGIVLPPGDYRLAASLEGDSSVFDAVITESSAIATAAAVSVDVAGALRSLPVASGDPISPALLPTLVDGGSGYFGPNVAPGPLPWLGVSAGWVWSRRLRARCRQRSGSWRRQALTPEPLLAQQRFSEGRSHGVS
ncbi:MAG: hypothetical protein ACK6BC_10800 [Cyanobacteriota bacterium]